MAQAILLTGRERRRRWSSDERRKIPEAAVAPGSNVSEVARRFDISTGLIYTWRRQALVIEKGPAFVSATVTDFSGSSVGGTTTVRVEFANGTTVKIASCTPHDLAAAVIRALK